MIKIVLVGGGSGGHFYPLIAVAEQVADYKKRGLGVEMYYMGTEAYNQADLDANGISFIYCPSGKRRKYFSLLNYLDVFKVIYGFFVAVHKLYLLYPDVVFSKGSYTSVPVTLAAWVLRIPVVVHESDTRPGSANKLASRFARYVAISFEEVAQYFPQDKIGLTGIPLRKAFVEKIDNSIGELGLPSEKPLIFVTGGSFGAQRLNSLILESLNELLPLYVILHQTGEAHAKEVQSYASTIINDTQLLSRYFVKGSLSAHEMNLAETAASLIISRAGTGSIYEIAQKGKPAILIPIPEAISHDQKTNAYAYARTGGASVLEEGNLTDGLLASEISRIMENQEVYDSMQKSALAFGHTDASLKIADTLIGIAQEH